VVYRAAASLYHLLGRNVPTDTADEFAAKLQPVYAMIAAVREALSSPKGLMGPPTWYGGRADAWRGDWDARRSDIEAFLNSAQEECRSIMRSQGRHV
jgi:hypothetical protein